MPVSEDGHPYPISFSQRRQGNKESAWLNPNRQVPEVRTNFSILVSTFLYAYEKYAMAKSEILVMERR